MLSVLIKSYTDFSKCLHLVDIFKNRLKLHKRHILSIIAGRFIRTYLWR